MNNRDKSFAQIYEDEIRNTTAVKKTLAKISAKMRTTTTTRMIAVKHVTVITLKIPIAVSTRI